MSDPNQNNNPRSPELWPGTGPCVRFTILVLENDRIVRNVLRRTLESFGHIVLEAGTGREAVELLRSQQGLIHILLSELIDTEIDQEVFEAFSQKYPPSTVVYMSSQNKQFIVGSSDRRNPWFVVEKPFRPAELARVLGELVNRKQLNASSFPNQTLTLRYIFRDSNREHCNVVEDSSSGRNSFRLSILWLELLGHGQVLTLQKTNTFKSLIRVSHGGAFAPLACVSYDYDRGLKLLPHIRKQVDDSMLFDNTTHGHGVRLTAHFHQGKIVKRTEPVPRRAQKISCTEFGRFAQ